MIILGFFSESTIPIPIEMTIQSSAGNGSVLVCPTMKQCNNKSTPNVVQEAVYCTSKNKMSLLCYNGSFTIARKCSGNEFIIFSLHTLCSSVGPLETFDFIFLNMCLLIND